MELVLVFPEQSKNTYFLGKINPLQISFEAFSCILFSLGVYTTQKCQGQDLFQYKL